MQALHVVNTGQVKVLPLQLARKNGLSSGCSVLHAIETLWVPCFAVHTILTHFLEEGGSIEMEYSFAAMQVTKSQLLQITSGKDSRIRKNIK